MVTPKKSPKVTKAATKTDAQTDVPEVAETPRDSFLSKFIGVLLILANVAVRVYCGLYMIISDCDETYNYWEPLNRIARGFGKQTWEYSPAYAIRSYAYLIPYYLITNPLRDFDLLTGETLLPSAMFYYIRVVGLAGFTAYAEIKLYWAVRRNFSNYTANWFLLFSTFAPGMAHASVALLPLSWAMTWITLGTALAIEVLGDVNDLSVVGPSIKAISCFLTAGLFGWPFALAIGIPFGLFTLRARYQTPPLTRIVFAGWAIFPAMVIFLICVDSYFYSRDALFVPFNIVLYNVFSGEGEGPEIFGVEPFLYYLLNLALNFNVVLVLGYLGAVVIPYTSSKAEHYRSAFGASVPILVWSFIFFRQPHKEERFLYPIYTLICLSAAIFTARVWKFLRESVFLRMVSRVLVLLSVALYITLSGSRILSLVYNYSAPLTTAAVFLEIENENATTGIQNVCIGREWYHFPTSFFLPDNYRLRFVKSGFDGLLPGDFEENVSIKQAASIYPAGINAKNIFSEDKVVPFDTCDFYIDNSSPVPAGEPDVFGNAAWKAIACEKIADPSSTEFNLKRILHIPTILDKYIPGSNEQMDYCVFQRVNGV